MSIPLIQTSFSAGEIAPSLYGHVDLARMHVAATTLRNMVVSYRGGAYSRAGTAFVARAKQSILAAPPRLIRFQFSINQGYCLEFGDNYMRVHFDGAPVVEAGFAITQITQSNPAAVTATNNFVPGDWVVLSGFVGMAQLQNKTVLVVNATPVGFTIATLEGGPIDSSTYAGYVSGGTAARIYTLATPYVASDLPLLKFTQSADVMSFAHANYPPYDLSRITATNWTLLPVTFGAALVPPAVVTGSATVHPSQASSPPTLPAAYAYVVTSVSGISADESIASPTVNITDSVDIAATAGSLIVNWSPVPGALTYNIYKAPVSYNTLPGNTSHALPVPPGSLFGYVGTSYGTQFVDSNIVADTVQVPPLHENPFAPGQVIEILPTAQGSGYTVAALAINTSTGSGLVAEPVIVGTSILSWIVAIAGSGYLPTDTGTVVGDGSGATVALTIGPESGTFPSVVAYFQQRRVYASTANNPDTYFMSKPGLFKNFDSAIPVQDNDAIIGTPWSQQVNGIQFMLPMPGGLVVLTGLGAWQVTGAGGSALNPVAITPASQQAQPQSFNGCSATVLPVTISNDIIYVQAKGAIARDLAYNYWTNNYTGTDLTQISNQLFTNFTISDLAWCEEPLKVAWFLRNDGVLLSLTYLKEQEVFGWARHDTFGQVKSICSVTEPPVDALYTVTTRYPAGSVNGSFYYIERMDDRLWNGVEDCWCIDCGLQYPMPTPAAQLYASFNQGNVLLSTSANVFWQVGQVVRMGGGIAYIKAVADAAHAVGFLVTPITNTFPNAAAGTVYPSPPGTWTLTQPVTTVTGLDHLTGMVVTGLADGVVIPPQRVSAAGSITLPFPASNIKVGLGYTAQMQSVYMDTGSQPTVQGRRKTVTAVTVRVESSAMLMAGTNQPDGAAQIPPRLDPVWSGLEVIPDRGGTYISTGEATVTNLFSGDLRVNLQPDWNSKGQVAVQQSNPLPLQITALIPETLEGDLPEAGYQEKGGGGQDDRRQTPRGPGAWMLRG